jgi:hypothetical protein
MMQGRRGDVPSQTAAIVPLLLLLLLLLPAAAAATAAAACCYFVGRERALSIASACFGKTPSLS